MRLRRLFAIAALVAVQAAAQGLPALAPLGVGLADEAGARADGAGIEAGRTG